MSSKSIRNIIFDLGGVILNIDPQLTIDAFRKLGWNNFYEGQNQSLNKELFFNLEKGNSSPGEFRDNVRQMIKCQIDDIDIDKAWTAMILDIPEERIRYLEELKMSYRIFLLSNTNEIHRKKFHKDFEEVYGYSFYDLFERNFYSHEMGMRKPDPRIFIQTMKEAGLVAGQTLYIDDMEENIKAAKIQGMKVLHIQTETLLEYLPPFLEDNNG